MTLEDSSTYQMIIEKGIEKGIAKGEARGIALGEARGVVQGVAQGAAKEARNLVVRLGSKRFGAPSSAVATALNTTDDLHRLERIADRLLDAQGWDDLLATE